MGSEFRARIVLFPLFAVLFGLFVRLRGVGGANTQRQDASARQPHPPSCAKVLRQDANDELLAKQKGIVCGSHLL